MPSINQGDILQRMITFLDSIGINVVEKALPDDTVLPGISVQGSTIFMDLDKLKYPGDLLHEAGHIATTEERHRPFIGTDKIEINWPEDGNEIAAIIWSYAASHHLNLNLDIVFHPHGYKNESQWLIEQFNNGVYIGLPLLEWMYMCNQDEFPKMKNWMR